MSKKHYKKNYTVCCFCFSLQTGSIILTLLWMGASLGLGMILLHTITDPDGDDPFALHEYMYDTAYVLAFGTILTLFVSCYGLYALIVKKTDRSIRIYSNLTWLVMVGLWSLFSLIAMITLAINKSQFTYPDLQKYMIKLIGLIIGTCTINIYFCIILRIYLARRHQEINSQEESHNYRDSLASTIAKWVESRNNSLRTDMSRGASMRADFGERLDPRVFSNLHQPIIQESPTKNRISKITMRRTENEQDETDAYDNTAEIIEKPASDVATITRRRTENEDETDAYDNTAEIIEKPASDVTTSTGVSRSSASLEHTEVTLNLDTPIGGRNLTEYPLYL